MKAIFRGVGVAICGVFAVLIAKTFSDRLQDTPNRRLRDSEYVLQQSFRGGTLLRLGACLPRIPVYYTSENLALAHIYGAPRVGNDLVVTMNDYCVSQVEIGPMTTLFKGIRTRSLFATVSFCRSNEHVPWPESVTLHFSGSLGHADVTVQLLHFNHSYLYTNDGVNEFSAHASFDGFKRSKEELVYVKSSTKSGMGKPLDLGSVPLVQCQLYDRNGRWLASTYAIPAERLDRSKGDLHAVSLFAKRAFENGYEIGLCK